MVKKKLKSEEYEAYLSDTPEYKGNPAVHLFFGIFCFGVAMLLFLLFLFFVVLFIGLVF